MLKSRPCRNKSATSPRVGRIRERIARVAERSGRRAEEITLVAVSKTVPADAVRAAYEAGLRDFGENRVRNGGEAPKARRPWRDLALRRASANQ